MFSLLGQDDIFAGLLGLSVMGIQSCSVQSLVKIALISKLSRELKVVRIIAVATPFRF